MSREIENDHRWNASEIEYLLARGRDEDVEANQKEFPEGWKPPEPEEDSEVVLELSQEVYEFVNSLDVAGLKAELKKAGIKPTGNEVELKVQLAQHLQDLEDKNADDA